MVSVLMALVLTGATSETSNRDYDSAYKEAVSGNKPLMVVVGAEWCPACNVLKNTTINPMVRTGELDQVSVALVDKDKNPELVKQLTKGEKMLPQIIVFTPTKTGWTRRKLMGYQPKQPVRNLVRIATTPRIDAVNIR